MDKAEIIVISCGIFREELEHLIAEEALDITPVFLDAALHVNFDKLKSALTTALEEARARGKRPRVLYGYCHPEMQEILDAYGAERIAAGNCLEAIIGPDEVARSGAQGKTFYLTAGWVNNYEKMFALGKEDFGFDFSGMFKDYVRIVVYDTGIIPIDEAKVEAFRAFTGLPVERRKITLEHLTRKIRELIGAAPAPPSSSSSSSRKP